MGATVSTAGAPSRCLLWPPCWLGAPPPHLHYVQWPVSQVSVKGSSDFTKLPAPATAPRAAVGCQEGGGEPRGPGGQVLSES